MGLAGFSARKNPERLRSRAGDADRRVPDLDPLSKRLEVVTAVASISSPHAALGLASEASNGILAEARQGKLETRRLKGAALTALVPFLGSPRSQQD